MWDEGWKISESWKFMLLFLIYKFRAPKPKNDPKCKICVLHLALDQQYSLGTSSGRKREGATMGAHLSFRDIQVVCWDAVMVTTVTHRQLKILRKHLIWIKKTRIFARLWPLYFILHDRHHMQTCCSCSSSLKAIDGSICALLKSSLTAPFPSCKLLVHIRNNWLYFEQLTLKLDQPWKISSMKLISCSAVWFLTRMTGRSPSNDLISSSQKGLSAVTFFLSQNDEQTNAAKHINCLPQ